MEEEEIEVKPSIEIIPDEYQHFAQISDEKIQAHIFSISNQEAKNKVKCFRDILESNAYECFEHSLEKDNCKDILNQIAANCWRASGLILFFCGKSNNEGQMKMFDGEKEDYIVLHNIWEPFYSQTCSNLKNKPKIFIFEINVIKAVETDGLRMSPPCYELTYDTPNEADIFILYHRSREDGEDDYIENFCENIKTYGQSEDITSLATCVARPLYSPMLISTFTRKFYFAASHHRGHHHNITEKQRILSEEISLIKTLTISKEPEKLKSKPSFIKRIFRNGSSSSDKNKQKTHSKNIPIPDKSSDVLEKTVKIISPRKESLSTETDTKGVKPKTPSMRHKDVRPRSRTLSRTSLSTSSDDIKKSNQKKPWRF